MVHACEPNLGEPERFPHPCASMRENMSVPSVSLVDVGTVSGERTLTCRLGGVSEGFHHRPGEDPGGGPGKILPGLRMFFGSNAALTARRRSSSRGDMRIGR